MVSYLSGKVQSHFVCFDLQFAAVRKMQQQLLGEISGSFSGKMRPCFPLNPQIFSNSAVLELVNADLKILLNLQMTYIIIAHTYEQWDRWGSLMYLEPYAE